MSRLGLALAILNGVNVFMAIIVLAVVSGEIVLNVGDQKICLLSPSNDGRNFRACDTGIAISTIAMILGLLYVALAVIEQLSDTALSAFRGKTAVIIRGGVAGFMAFLWLVCFGVVVNFYNDNSFARFNSFNSKQGAQAVSAFSFFSILGWCAVAIIMIVFRAIRGDGPSVGPPVASGAASPAP